MGHAFTGKPGKKRKGRPSTDADAEEAEQGGEDGEFQTPAVQEAELQAVAAKQLAAIAVSAQRKAEEELAAMQLKKVEEERASATALVKRLQDQVAAMEAAQRAPVSSTSVPSPVAPSPSATVLSSESPLLSSPSRTMSSSSAAPQLSPWVRYRIECESGGVEATAADFVQWQVVQGLAPPPVTPPATPPRPRTVPGMFSQSPGFRTAHSPVFHRSSPVGYGSMHPQQYPHVGQAAQFGHPVISPVSQMGFAPQPGQMPTREQAQMFLAAMFDGPSSPGAMFQGYPRNN